MSVTFSLASKPGPEAPSEPFPRVACPECGGMPYIGHVEGEKQGDQFCDTCLGYGGSPKVEEAWHARREGRNVGPTLNVANGNALVIFERLLNMHAPQYDMGGGELDPSAVLLALGTTAWQRESFARAPKVTRGVVLTPEGVSDGATWIECGLSPARIETYAVTLTAMAEAALEAGVAIVYG